MTKVDIEQTIVKETQELSFEALQEILEFIQFIKLKEQGLIPKSFPDDKKLHEELQALNTSSLAHLEEEFANYKELYPQEQ